MFIEVFETQLKEVFEDFPPLCALVWVPTQVCKFLKHMEFDFRDFQVWKSVKNVK